jgi:hypothetical protein
VFYYTQTQPSLFPLLRVSLNGTAVPSHRSHFLVGSFLSSLGSVQKKKKKERTLVLRSVDTAQLCRTTSERI